MIISPFSKTRREVAIRMLKLANVKEGDILFDLGAGDGEIIITCAKHFGATSIGIEINRDLCRRAAERVKLEGVSDRAYIINGDLFQTNLNRATVITLYLTSKANALLKEKFKRELRDNTRIVTNMFPIPGWEPYAIDMFHHGSYFHYIYLYIMGKSDVNLSEIFKRIFRKRR